MRSYWSTIGKEHLSWKLSDGCQNPPPSKTKKSHETVFRSSPSWGRMSIKLRPNFDHRSCHKSQNAFFITHRSTRLLFKHGDNVQSDKYHTRYLPLLLCSITSWRRSRIHLVEKLDSRESVVSINQISRLDFLTVLDCGGLNGELFAGLGPMIILLAEVILMMRVYALYEKSKFLLAFFIFLTAGLLGFNILQLSHLFLNIEIKTCLNGDCFQVVKRTRRAFIAEGTLLNFECMYALPISGIGWAVTSVVELLLFVLVIMKARKWEGSDSATQAVKNNPPRVRHIATRMARASIVYFAVIFTVCCIGAAVMFIEENAPFNVLIRWIIEYNRLPYETFVITVMTILAPKLILDLRKEFYGPPERKDTELTWNADVPTYSTMDGSLEGYSDREVLETFMD